jgi:hypothetical protein
MAGNTWDKSRDFHGNTAGNLQLVWGGGGVKKIAVALERKEKAVFIQC